MTRLGRPERLATVLSLVVVVLLAAGRIGAIGQVPGSSPGPSARPSASVGPTAPPVDRTTIEFLLGLHVDLAGAGTELAAMADTTPFPVASAIATLRDVRLQVRLGMEATRRLATRATTAALAADQEAFYDGLTAIIDDTLAASLANTEAYRSGATALAAELARLVTYDDRLRAALEGILATFGPASPTPDPSASVAPTPAVTPPPSEPPPSEPAVSPTAGPSFDPGLLRNGGFEGAVLAPWEVVVSDPAATATVALDDLDAYEGGRAARVVIAAGSQSRSGIALVQDGVRLETGRRYTFSIAARADGPRELRLRVVGPTGQTFGTGVVTIDDEWRIVTLTFTSIDTLADARVEVGLGRFTETTWLDAASFVVDAPLP